MYYMLISYTLYAHINNQYDPNISYIKLDETPMLNEVKKWNKQELVIYS